MKKGTNRFSIDPTGNFILWEKLRKVNAEKDKKREQLLPRGRQESNVTERKI